MDRRHPDAWTYRGPSPTLALVACLLAGVALTWPMGLLIGLAAFTAYCSVVSALFGRWLLACVDRRQVRQ